MPSHMIKVSTVISLLVLLATFVSVGVTPVRADEPLAIKGYDPVAYFTTAKATKGDPHINYAWDDAVYRFASTKHRDIFKSDPDKYAPVYRGFCTVALARGVRFVADPNKWLIHDGRLHVFGSSVDLDKARLQIAQMKSVADDNYKRLDELPVKQQSGTN